MPWLMQLAGIEAPETLEAESLAPALSGDFAGRESVYCEQAQDRFMTNALMTMVRTADWKLVHFLGEDYGQLFDLRDDPAEENDRWSDPAAAGAKAELLDRLHEWRMRSQLQTSDWMAQNR